MTKRDSIPWPALRAFVAAARTGSFRDAARDMGVTPSAVSHQIKALETHLGSALFDRGVRVVQLTPRGRALNRSLARAFESIESALSLAQATPAPTELRIAALPLFVSVWLAPRLHRFEAAFPNLSIAVETDARVVDVAAGEADVAIRNVPAPTPGLHVRKLMDLRATPLCAPTLAATLTTPADLAGATLIGLSVGRAGWSDWLAAAGAPGLKPKRTLTFDTLPAAIEATARGRGVMLGLMPLIWDAPAAQDLVAPFTIPPQDAGAYFVVCRKADRTAPVTAAFMDWLFAEMRPDMRRLMRIERARLNCR